MALAPLIFTAPSSFEPTPASIRTDPPVSPAPALSSTDPPVALLSPADTRMEPESPDLLLPEDRVRDPESNLDEPVEIRTLPDSA